MQHDLAVSLIDAFDRVRAGAAAEPFRVTVERAVKPLLPPERVVLTGQLAWIASAALNALPRAERDDLLRVVAGIDNLSRDGIAAAQVLGQLTDPRNGSTS